MTTPAVVALGRRLKPLATVPQVGELLGLSRGQAFRAVAEWPTIGTAGARRVIVPALLDALEIPYEIEATQTPGDPE